MTRPDEVPVAAPVVTDAALGAEAARLPAATADRLDVEVGRQVRLRRGRECGLFTVVGRGDRVELPPGGPGLLAGDGELRATGRAITPARDAPAGTLHGTVHPGDGLLALAPHGGLIEPRTDDAAARAAARGATAWYCRGAWPGRGGSGRGATGARDGGAFSRWHVTSTDLHPGSFPGLARVADRGPYATAVSFHGWRGEGVGVGGAAPRPVRERVAGALRARLPGGVDVRLCPDGPYAGTDPSNVVNRYARDGGVQIEASARVRLDPASRRRLAEAAIDALRAGLNEEGREPVGP